jgi:hypothetical protein
MGSITVHCDHLFGVRRYHGVTCTLCDHESVQLDWPSTGYCKSKLERVPHPFYSHYDGEHHRVVLTSPHPDNMYSMELEFQLRGVSEQLVDDGRSGSIIILDLGSITDPLEAQLWLDRTVKSDVKRVVCCTQHVLKLPGNVETICIQHPSLASRILAVCLERTCRHTTVQYLEDHLYNMRDSGLYTMGTQNKMVLLLC